MNETRADVQFMSVAYLSITQRLYYSVHLFSSPSNLPVSACDHLALLRLDPRVLPEQSLSQSINRRD